MVYTVTKVVEMRFSVCNYDHVTSDRSYTPPFPSIHLPCLSPLIVDELELLRGVAGAIVILGGALGVALGGARVRRLR